MRLLTLSFTSAICAINILSQNFASCSNFQELSLCGTLVIWSLVPTNVHSTRVAPSKTPVDFDDHKIIDDILKKGEIEKAKQKQEVKIGAKSYDRELDPLKCFPKALCGVSSEVEQISKRKKNGLISEYLILMKAVTRHPGVLDDVVSTSSKTNGASEKNKKKGKDKPQDDLNDDASGSEEDDEDNESDEEEDDEDVEDDEDNKPVKKKNQKKEKPPKTDEEFHKAYLKEKVEMDKLLKETIMKDDNEREQVWWDSDRPPGQPWLNRPEPQTRPSRPWGFGGGGGGGGHIPYYRRDDEEPSKSEDGIASSGGGIAGLSSFFRNLFGFGDTSLTNDPWFQSAARDLSGEVAPGIAVDETREILETALDIGKQFDKPSQCNEIFNACQYDYTELLYMIDDLRINVRTMVKEHGKQKSKGNGKKKENAKSELPTRNSQTKSKAGRRRKPGKASSSIPDYTSGKVPDERYVIPVIPQQSTFADTFQFSNVLSWLGLGGAGSY